MNLLTTEEKESALEFFQGLSEFSGVGNDVRFVRALDNPEDISGRISWINWLIPHLLDIAIFSFFAFIISAFVYLFLYKFIWVKVLKKKEVTKLSIFEEELKLGKAIMSLPIVPFVGAISSLIVLSTIYSTTYTDYLNSKSVTSNEVTDYKIVETVNKNSNLYKVKYTIEVENKLVTKTENVKIISDSKENKLSYINFTEDEKKLFELHFTDFEAKILKTNLFTYFISKENDIKKHEDHYPKVLYLK